MNSVTRTADSPATLVDLLNDFSTALDEEQEFLLRPSTDLLERIAIRKRELLHQINHVHPKVIDRVSRFSENDPDFLVISQIRRLLENCKLRNRDNGALVAQGLKVCSHSLSLIQNSVHAPSVETYDPSGRTDSDLAKRHIGQA